MESARGLAKLATHCSWNDHDNFESFIIGKLAIEFYCCIDQYSSPLRCLYFITIVESRNSHVDMMTALTY